MNIEEIDNIEFEGISYKDHPDYTDAFISSAEINGRKLTDSELDELNEDSEFVYRKLESYLY